MIRFYLITLIILTQSTNQNSVSNINHPTFTKEKAGFFVWTTMHLYSAYIPEKPTKIEQEEISTLIKLL